MKKLIIMLAAIAMVGAFTVTSAMADASLYGSARFNTYSVHNDKDWSSTGFSDTDTQWRMGNLSRFGAIFKGDKVSGRFEVDARVNQPDDDSNGSSGVGSMRLRLLYGVWDFGPGQLLIGQNYPLFNFAISSIAYTTGGLQPWGGAAYLVARVSQIRFTFGDFKIAFITPNTSSDGGGPYTVDTDTTLPKIEVEYDLKVDPASFQFVGGWQSYDAVDANDDSKAINSWVLAAAGKVHFGPAYVNLAISYRVNGTNYGVWTSVDEAATYVTSKGDFQDTTTWGGVAAVGFKVNDTLTFEASASYEKADYDSQGSREDTARAYGVLAKVHLAPGVMIQPEVLLFDKDKVKDAAGNETDQGKQTVIGVWWIINFK